jgi:PAS domain S-box-containing protein
MNDETRSLREARQGVLLQLSRLEMADLDETLRALARADAHALGVERVGIWEFEPDGAAIHSVVSYRTGPDVFDSGAVLCARDYPSYFAALAEERVIAADDAARDHRTSEFRQGYLEPLGISSRLDVPIWRRGAVVGIVCHEQVGRARTWTQEEQEFAANIADLASRALEADERRRAEQDRERLFAELAVRVEQWEQVVSAMTDGVWIVGSDGRVQYANPGAARLVGVEHPDELLGPLDAYSRFVAVEDEAGQPLPSEAWPLRQALDGQRVVGARMTLRSLRTGESRVIQVSAAPIRARRQAVAVAVEVTERARFERYVDEFVALAAHELKTPVTVVKGCAQMLARGGSKSPARTAELLLMVERGADRINRITTDLLSMSRLRMGCSQARFTRVDLAALVRDVTGQFAATTRSHRVSVSVTEPCVVQGDEQQLARVLTSLLGNAARFSRPGSEVAVELRTLDGWVALSVRDHGIGVPARDRQRVFERFYRAHAGTEHDPGGLGVGLYIAREIVLRHGGAIDLDTVEGEGSTFTVRLPAAPSVSEGP